MQGLTLPDGAATDDEYGRRGKTGAVQPGSRVAWRYKFAGDAEQLANYEQWLLPKLGPEHRWIGLDRDDSALGKSSNARSNSCCYPRC